MSSQEGRLPADLFPCQLCAEAVDFQVNAAEKLGVSLLQAAPVHKAEASTQARHAGNTAIGMGGHGGSLW